MEIRMNVTAILSEVMDDPDTSEKDKDGIIRSYFHHLKALKKAFKVANGPLVRAKSVHVSIDKYMDHQKKADPEIAKRIACKKGCSACCYQPVRITDDEADTLLKVVHDLPWDKIERQARVSDKEWNDKLSAEDQACVFLQNNECLPYEYRPAACRQYNVLDDSSLCDMDHPSSRLPRFVSVNAETLTSAFWTLRDDDTVPRMLLKRREFNDGHSSG